jgi:uncharacterized protein (TIGR02268 family)
MPALSFAALLSLVLPAGATANEVPPLPDCDAPRPRHHLPAEPEWQSLEVCISPEMGTVLVFDSPLLPGSVRLQGAERFLDLSLGRQSITVLPRKDLKPWERFELTAHFADGAAPLSASFVLVGHPSRAARQVEVFRQPRTMASYQQEAREARAEAQRYREENARLRAELGRPDGLLGLIASGQVDNEGVLARNLAETVSQEPEDGLRKRRVTSYRATPVSEEGGRKMVQLVLQVELSNLGMESWMAEGASLTGPRGEALAGVRVWQEAPAEPDKLREVLVVAEVPSPRARGIYTLKLWDASGGRTVTLEGVTFP